MALGALAKGLLKREARVMGADKVAARGKKMVSNRRKRVANRRASAQQIMGGGEEGEATTVRPTTSLIPKSSAIVPYSGGGVGSKGGSKGGNLESINNSLMVVASIMKSNLALDKGLHKQEEKAEEEQKRKEEEKRLETPKKDPKDKEEKVKIPGLGFLEGIMGFFVKYLWAAVIMKLVDFAANPMVMGIIKGLAKVGDFLINFSIGAIDVFASFIHWGYKLVEMMKGFVTNIFGDEGAKKFDIFMGNIKNLINAFLVWKFIGQKIFKGLVKNITRVFKFAKNIIRRASIFVKRLIGPAGRKAIKSVLGKVGSTVTNIGKNILSKGAGILSKGTGAVTGKVGGLATKIFGKAAKFIAPALKAATPAVKGFASRIPILGPVIVAIVSLLSGESVGQALFKGVGAALGGALGTFIPIPILGTLLGETIGMFVGDMLYYTIMEKNPAKAFDMLKTALMGIFGFLTKIPILGNLIQLLQKGGNVIWTFGKWLFFDGIGWVLAKLGGAAKLLKEWMQAGMKRFVDNFPVFNLPLMKFKIFRWELNINWLLGKAFGGIPWFKQWIDGEEQLMHFPDFSMFIPALGLPFLIGHVGKSLFPGSFFEGWPSGISAGVNPIKEALTKKIDKNKEKVKENKEKFDKKFRKKSDDPKEMDPKEMGLNSIPKEQSKQKNNDTINAVSNKASYEGGEGSSKIIPVPIPNKNNTPSSTGKTTVGLPKSKSVDSNDPSLLLYAGK